jgi:hypothetical protein
MTSSAPVHVSEHSFGVFDQYEIPIETADWSTGLVVEMSVGAMIYTGINRGYVHVIVDARATHRTGSTPALGTTSSRRLYTARTVI